MTTTEVSEPDLDDPDSPAHAPWFVVVFVAGVIVAGVAFRFTTRSQMWLDEALAVNIAHLPARQIPTWLRHDGAPPLYYLLLHYWMKIFGTSNLGARSLSGVFSVASFPLAWYCGKRIGGRATAWTVIVVMSINTYAVLYATSARMYSMETFIVFAGILAVRRAFEQPTVERLALVSALVAILIYTQYWGFYITAALVLVLLGALRRAPAYRDTARRMLIAIAVGLVTFVPWLPNFLYQARHTGTPWGKAVLPAAPIGTSIQDFSGGLQQEGWLLLLLFIPLAFLGTFGRRVRDGHIDVDPHGQPRVRWEALIGAATLVIGATATYLSRNAFQTRYASVVFPFFVLVVARGLACFSDRRLRALALVGVVGLGAIGCVRNVVLDRTSADKVAAIIKRNAKPGDIVLYCPDQTAPAVHRLLPHDFDEMTYPKLRKPALIDWVDYKAVLARHKPAVVAQQVLSLAGSHTIWYVSAPGYSTHKHSCDILAAALQKSRPLIPRRASDPNAFEKQGLKEFPAH